MRYAFLILILLASPALAAQDTDGSLANLSAANRTLVENVIGESLRDPVNAQYRRVRMIVNRGNSVVCGEVNGRNAYGGYVGFEPFSIRSYPDGKRSTLNPAAFMRGTRPLMRQFILDDGCGLPSQGQPVTTERSDKLLRAYAAENETCRGGPGDDASTLKACDRREAVSRQLRTAGWCYGRENEYGYQYDWHRCEPNSLRRR